MNKYYISVILIGSILAGCNNTQPQVQQKHSKYEKPEWINNTLGGAVGSCGPHMNGNAAQEEVAMNRALRELAKQQKANISSKSTSMQTENAIGYTSTNSNNTEVKSDVEVSSKVKAKWRDPKTNTFYIWMVVK